MVNTAGEADLTAVSKVLPKVVAAATSYLEGQLEDQVARITAQLEQTTQRLRTWQVEARTVADAMTPGAQQSRRREDIERVTRRIEGLINENKPAGTPLIRVLAALVPKN